MTNKMQVYYKTSIFMVQNRASHQTAVVVVAAVIFYLTI